MKVLIISGFLGAGKTSFIRNLVQATGKEFVVVENEFAAENVDSKILEQYDKEKQMKVWEMTEGCICCSLNMDFSYSVLTIANTLHPEYLIVEPSGVAQPSAILESLSKISYEKISLLAPITIVDAKNYLFQRRNYMNYFEDQLATAGTVVLSKSEDLSAGEFEHIQENLKTEEDVAFPMSHYKNWSEEDWLRLLTKECNADDIRNIGKRFVQKNIQREADMDLTTLTVMDCEMRNVDQLYALMEGIFSGEYGDIIRAKGFVHVGGEVLLTELVNQEFSIIGIGKAKDLRESSDQPELKNRMVFIGKNIREDKIKRKCKNRGILQGKMNKAQTQL